MSARKREVAMRWCAAFIFCLATPVSFGPPSSLAAQAAMRGGDYAGAGYRFLGTASGTGGKVFRDVRPATRRCDYFNPGCETRISGNYVAPKVGPGYVRPQTGPGLVQPRVGRGLVQPRVGPGLLHPRVGPGFVQPRS